MPVRATFGAEFKAFLCGALTLVTAVAIVRDLVVGISGFAGVYPLGLGSGRGVGLFADNGLRYARADHPTGYGIIDHPEDRALDLLRGRDVAFYRIYRRRCFPHPKAIDPAIVGSVRQLHISAN
jgi:hypothetical protein